MPFRLSSILCSLKSPLKAWNHLRIPQLVLLAWNHLKEVYLMITLDASTVIKYHGNWMWKQFVIEFYNCIMCRLRLNLFNRQQNVIWEWQSSSFLFNVSWVSAWNWCCFLHSPLVFVLVCRLFFVQMNLSPVEDSRRVLEKPSGKSISWCHPLSSEPDPQVLLGQCLLDHY